MSQKLINHSEDLQKLKGSGYQIEVRNDRFLLVHNIPYVNQEKRVCRGVLVSELSLSGAGDKTGKPASHVCFFIGDQPCDADGSVIAGIIHTQTEEILAEGLTIQRSFSSKPSDGYTDYDHKMVTYCKILENQAIQIDPSVSAKDHSQSIDSSSDHSVFIYPDANSSRAEISTITSKVSNMKIAIIGLGGTGSYILDFLAKTEVKEIHLFDDDIVKMHNAFRMPGAVTKKTLEQEIKKVEYLKQIYSEMRTGIEAHEFKIENKTLNQLGQINLNFVFICIDGGSSKKPIIDHLANYNIPFIDVGICVLRRVNDSLLDATARTTFVDNPNVNFKEYIPLEDGERGLYHDANIQIAEVNAINAVMAVIQWKKWARVYADSSNAFNSCYDLSHNKIILSKC